jgi:hypothetical protein
MADTGNGPHEGNDSLGDAPNEQVPGYLADPVCPRCGTSAEGSAYCSSCGLHLAAEPALPTRVAWEAATRSHVQSEKPATPTPAPTSASRRQAILIPLVGLLAVVALAVGIASFVADRPSSVGPLKVQLRQLRQELSTANRQLASDGGAISSLKASSQVGVVSNLRESVSKLNHSVSTLQSRLADVMMCIPQLTDYVDDFTASGSYVTDSNGDELEEYPVTISSGAQVSSNCTSVIYGAGG